MKVLTTREMRWRAPGEDIYDVRQLGRVEFRRICGLDRQAAESIGTLLGHSTYLPSHNTLLTSLWASDINACECWPTGRTEKPGPYVYEKRFVSARRKIGFVNPFTRLLPKKMLAIDRGSDTIWSTRRI